MDSIIDLLIRISPGIIAAFLGSRWAVSKFYEEKIWERKERAYEEIINALYDLINYFRVHKEDYGQGTGLSDESENALYQKYCKAATALNKATDIGSFYISPEAENVLIELRERERLDFRYEPRFELYYDDYQAHKKALNELMPIAKGELRVVKSHSWFTLLYHKVTLLWRSKHD